MNVRLAPASSAIMRARLCNERRGELAAPHRVVPRYLTELALTFAKSRLPKPVSSSQPAFEV
ncbi:hypothetical protein BLA18112_00426 [Burkholderia lata]|uniref:Uncharacterized protein n=1 Tax=Burkholderia lata (strain ATCC 17760 / DSM 23089 / LMG 22485 / NCIMB 9086 / R18194 / 383) TaxID=482957 RepID=A0A6P2T0U1_BURL3|nr:hypothetical protein BLA18112_00426 [Burkholderia lata]